MQKLLQGRAGTVHDNRQPASTIGRGWAGNKSNFGPRLTFRGSHDNRREQRQKNHMKQALLILGLLLASTSAYAQAWTCSAPGMISGSYDGGESAYIHLNGFPSGGTYPVRKQGKRATGTTKNAETIRTSKSVNVGFPVILKVRFRSTNM